MDRRTMLRLGAATAAGLAFGPGFWREAFGAPAVAGPSPYGPIGAPDALGVRLPTGFSARLIARTGAAVGPSGYVWPGEPDGAAVFARPGGGWIYVCNSELNGQNGGVSAVRFSASGDIDDAYRILGGTKWNCAGGATSWGTWLSCEEYRQGFVWECDPSGPGQGVARPALGTFAHEAAVVDPATGFVYLTEDNNDSRVYRFRPTRAADLSEGVLEAAAVDGAGQVSWLATSALRPDRSRRTTAFARGEGAWFSGGRLYFCTTADDKVWELDPAASTIEVIYDAAVIGADAPLRKPDNVTVDATTGDIYVAEDGDDLQLVLLANQSGARIAAPFLQFEGHGTSEVTGPVFTPDGTRMYVSSQRGIDGNGLTFEVTGPFRGR